MMVADTFFWINSFYQSRNLMGLTKNKNLLTCCRLVVATTMIYSPLNCALGDEMKEAADNFFLEGEKYSMKSVFLSIPRDLIPLSIDEKIDLIINKSIILEGDRSLIYVNLKSNTLYHLVMLDKGSQHVLLMRRPYKKAGDNFAQHIKLVREKGRWKWHVNNK